MSQIIFATANQHKVDEINRINNSDTFISLTDAGITEEIPETGQTFHENAFQKANYVFKRKSQPVFAEDSGLVVDALNGAPGVYSARFAGDAKDHDKNIDKVLELLKDVTDRRAHFASVICFISKAGDPLYFDGRCAGSIHIQRAGHGGFGYDPIFIPSGYSKTFGQLDDAIKDQISHRKKSFFSFMEYLHSTTL